MKKIKKIIPAYSWLPLILCVVINVLCFQGTRLFNRGLHHYDVALPIDELIPLVPASVVIYIGCYATWVISYVMIAREEQKICYKFFAAEIIGKLIATAIFMLFPTEVVRPEIAGGDIFSVLLRFIYAMDTPDNLFPSLHCFGSWMSWRGLLPCKNVPKWYKSFTFVLMFMVFASVLLTKQHLFVDIFGGIAVAELGFLIARLTGAYRLFELQKCGKIPENALEPPAA